MTETPNDLDHDNIGHFARWVQVPDQGTKTALVEVVRERDNVHQFLQCGGRKTFIIASLGN